MELLLRELAATVSQPGCVPASPRRPEVEAFERSLEHPCVLGDQTPGALQLLHLIERRPPHRGARHLITRIYVAAKVRRHERRDDEVLHLVVVAQREGIAPVPRTSMSDVGPCLFGNLSPARRREASRQPRRRRTRTPSQTGSRLAGKLSRRNRRVGGSMMKIGAAAANPANFRPSALTSSGCDEAISET